MSCGLPLNGRAWVFVTSRSKMQRVEPEEFKKIVHADRT